jgi:hypothetical protein
MAYRTPNTIAIPTMASHSPINWPESPRIESMRLPSV